MSEISSLLVNSSITSSHVDSSDEVGSIKVRNYVKELLRSRIFLGRYLERRLVDNRIGYRDIVIISNAEVELKRDLAEAMNKVRVLYPNVWIGVSDGSPVGQSGSVCLWTEIENQPFGIIWFQIKSVKFRELEVIITLKCVRHISESFLEVEPVLTGVKKTTTTSSSLPDSSTDALSDGYKEIVNTLKTALSIRNVKEFVTFVFALIIAFFTGSTAFINFLGNFSLALVRETSILIKNSTPMFLGFLEFLSKIVGGFYILVAMIFKPSNPIPQNRRSVTYYDGGHRRRRSDNYDDSGFD